jgi:hypothetical protein
MSRANVIVALILCLLVAVFVIQARNLSASVTDPDGYTCHLNQTVDYLCPANPERR